MALFISDNDRDWSRGSTGVTEISEFLWWSDRERSDLLHRWYGLDRKARAMEGIGRNTGRSQRLSEAFCISGQDRRLGEGRDWLKIVGESVGFVKMF